MFGALRFRGIILPKFNISSQSIQSRMLSHILRANHAMLFDTKIIKRPWSEERVQIKLM